MRTANYFYFETDDNAEDGGTGVACILYRFYHDPLRCQFLSVISSVPQNIAQSQPLVLHVILYYTGAHKIKIIYNKRPYRPYQYCMQVFI